MHARSLVCRSSNYLRFTLRLYTAPYVLRYRCAVPSRKLNRFACKLSPEIRLIDKAFSCSERIPCGGYPLPRGGEGVCRNSRSSNTLPQELRPTFRKDNKPLPKFPPEFMKNLDAITLVIGQGSALVNVTLLWSQRDELYSRIQFWNHLIITRKMRND